MNNYILKACQKCGGDLARDCGDWICLQCGTYRYVGLYSRDTRTPNRPVDSAAAGPGQPALPGLPFPIGGGDLPGRTERAAALITGAALPDSPACWAVSR